MRRWLKLLLLPLLILAGVSAQEQRGPILQGRVVNESDQPVASATVAIFSEGALVQTLYTSPEGLFTSFLPRPGQYNVVVNLDGFRPYTELLNLPREETVAYTFQLLPSSLHVVVLDVSQEKLSDAVVTVKGEDGVLRRAIESPKGDYYFGRLKPGIYQMTVSMPGYELAVDDGVYIPSDNKTMLRTQLLLRASPIPMADKKKERYLFPVVPANRVSGLMQDASGVIWAGTGRGIARFIGAGVTAQDGQAQIYAALDGLEVRQILQQSDGTYWFLTPSGLYYRKPWARVCEQFQLPGRQIRAIAEDRYKAIWIATDHGLLRYQEGKWAEYGQERGLASNDVRCVVAERQGDGVWVGTSAGVVRITRGQAQPFGEQVGAVVGLLEDSRGQVWILTEAEVKRYDGEQLTTLRLPQPASLAAEDKLGNIWFAGAKSGVYVYDMLRDEVGELYQSDHILAILSDREGNVWFGSENGLIYQDFYSFVSFNTSRGLQATDVRSLLPDPARPGGLWVGTLSGLIYYDGVSFQRIPAVGSELVVNHILAERDGTLWVATSNGLLRLSEGSWTRFGKRDGLPGDEVRTLCEDRRGHGLWVATGGGVSYFRPSSQTATTDQLQIKAAVRHIYQQQSGTLWFATDKGVYRYDPATYDLTIIGQSDGLESIDVRWIDEDPKSGLLLFATGKGIEFSDGRRVLVGRQPPALSGEGMNVIYRDRDGMFWFGAEDGKIRKFLYTDIPAVGYNGALLVSYSPDRYDIPGTSIRSIAQDSTGAIWFATDAGLVRHLPTQVAPSIDCRLEVDGAERFSNEVEAGRHNIKFRFWAISAAGETGFVYRAIVNGQPWDYHWISPQAAAREAVFNGLPEGNPFLPEGEHVFEVRAINRDLYFSQPLLFSIRIDRPFWKKTWFHLVLAVFLAIGVFSAVLVRRYQKREYTLPADLRVFHPIDPNPYIAGNPIRNPSMFFGREDDFNYARIKLEGAAQGGVVLVFCGERRAGKSSILYQIVNGRLGERFIPVFIDLQEMVIATDHEFFGRIAKLIAEAVEQHLDREVPELDRSRFPFHDRSHNAFHLFSDFVSAALAAIADRRLVILIDEYELLENKVEEGRLSKEIFNFLASIIESRDRLSFIFTGSRRLEERDRRYWREMLRRSLFRKVSFLSERDTLRLITLPVERKVVYGKGVREGIQRLTSGQPFYTQYICQSIVDHLNEWRRHYILKEDLEKIVEEIVDNPLPQMLYFWEGFSGDEKLVMSLLAEVLDGSDVVATAGKIAKVIAREGYPVTLSENSIRLILEELVRGDVLKRVGDDAYCFRIDLFRLWIRKSHSLWRVVREMVTV